ncbi:hypothetical protein PIROE2DRAFT_15855 [Piromyces sp. E2]|nr:hypothetical protein PIROE2DRAFT_15855 [Piromyces sp. E2]|eukprot:OUM58802.1 hypothetical protein PIROE2DRAFT_15855 [Piromyces sp. E2]
MECIKSNIKKNSLLNKNNLEYNVVCLRTLFGHTASVQCVDTLPTICVSGSSDGTIRLWHVESGNCIKIIYPSLLKSIPVYKMCPELTKIEEISYEPISCIKLTYNYLVAGTYSGHIYLIDIYAKEITADDIFRPEWTNWKKKNLDIVEAEENGNIINFIPTFNQGLNSSNQNKTKPNLIDDFTVPCNILTIRGREFAYEELIDWVNTPTNIKLNKIYNLDVNAIPIVPEYSYEDLQLMENNIVKQKEFGNGKNPNDASKTNDGNENNNNVDNDAFKNTNNNKNDDDNNNIEGKNDTINENLSLDKKNDLSMMDMSDFLTNQSLSNNHLNQSFDSKDDDISAFERQISMNCDYLYSKETINEESEKPSMIPKRSINEKTLKITTNSNKQKIETIKHSINEKTNIPKKATSVKKVSPNNEKPKYTLKSIKNKKKRSSKTNEKMSIDNYIYDDGNQKDIDENTNNEKVITESNNDIKSIENENENDPTKLEKSNEDDNSKNTSKIEKYLKERYSNNGKNTLDMTKKGNNINNRRFKLEVSSARWILGVQVDAWRLIAGGCEGRSIFWNHKIGTPIFEINKDTTNIITIPTLHAKKRKRKQKSKYNKSSTNENHSTIIGNTSNNENNENNTYDNNGDIEESNDTNNNEQVTSEKNVIDADKIHSFVYVPGKDQPITDVIFNERFLIISDIKGKLRIWEVHDFV